MQQVLRWNYYNIRNSEVTMDYIQDRNSNILFGLHDSKIEKITFKDNVLTLHLNKIFQYTEDEEKIYSGEVLFYGCDLDECSVMIFNRTVYEGDFSGKAVSLQDYIKKYSNVEFEFLQKDTLDIVQLIQDGFGKKEKSLCQELCIFGITVIWYII